MAKNVARAKPPIIYKPPPTSVSYVAEDALTYWVQCPKCEGRAMDLSDLPERPITVGCKCPCCNKFVDLPLVAFVDDKAKTTSKD